MTAIIILLLTALHKAGGRYYGLLQTRKLIHKCRLLAKVTQPISAGWEVSFIHSLIQQSFISCFIQAHFEQEVPWVLGGAVMPAV